MRSVLCLLSEQWALVTIRLCLVSAGSLGGSHSVGIGRNPQDPSLAFANTLLAMSSEKTPEPATIGGVVVTVIQQNPGATKKKKIAERS